MEDKKLHRVLIVGGGAGGLELATKLGDSLGKKKKKLKLHLLMQRKHIYGSHFYTKLLQEVLTQIRMSLII